MRWGLEWEGDNWWEKAVHSRRYRDVLQAPRDVSRLRAAAPPEGAGTNGFPGTPEFILDRGAGGGGQMLPQRSPPRPPLLEKSEV